MFCCDPTSRYSIENSVNDLNELIKSLQLSKFHLFGHSFGGIVSYEYMKRSVTAQVSKTDEKENHPHNHRCLSLTLANSPSNMKNSLEEYSRLEKEMTHELSLEMKSSKRETACEASMNQDIQERLRKRHECRTDNVPNPLVHAIRSRGTIWSGPEAVSDYVAQPPSTHITSCQSKSSSNTSPAVLLIRGEFDFITEKCIEEWRKIFKRDASNGIFEKKPTEKKS